MMTLSEVELLLGQQERRLEDAKTILFTLQNERAAIAAGTPITPSVALEALREVAMQRVREGKSVEFYDPSRGVIRVHRFEYPTYWVESVNDEKETQVLQDHILIALREATMIAAIVH